MSGKFKNGINAEGVIKSDIQGNVMGSFATMPTADAKFENIVVQFIGVTIIGGYVNGSFYKCNKQTDGTYLWELCNPPSSGGTTVTDYELTIGTTGWVLEGEFYVKTITLTGMTSTQYPIVSFTARGTTLAEVEEEMESASHILKAEPLTDAIKFYSDIALTKEIKVVAKVF